MKISEGEELCWGFHHIVRVFGYLPGNLSFFKQRMFRILRLGNLLQFCRVNVF